MPRTTTPIDRIDDNGRIVEHVTCADCIDFDSGNVRPDVGVARTLCGLRLYVGRTQAPLGNRRCRSCERVASAVPKATSKEYRFNWDVSCFGCKRDYIDHRRRVGSCLHCGSAAILVGKP